MHANPKVLALSVLLLLSPSVVARDLNRALHGDYAMTYSQACAQSFAGFTPQLQPIGSSLQRTTAVEMIQSYNGDGTSSAAAGRALQIISNNNTVSAARQEFSCTGTYQVNDDGSFSEDLNCSGTVTAGTSAGLAFTHAGIHRSGRIGILAQTLVITNTSPNVEAFQILPGGNPLSFICERSGTAVKIHGKASEAIDRDND